jgi:hypothetical protein
MQISDPHLSYERNEFPEMLRLLVGIEFKNLQDAVVVVPLLEELFFVRNRVTFYQILQLRQIRCEQNTAKHTKQRVQANKHK